MESQNGESARLAKKKKQKKSKKKRDLNGKPTGNESDLKIKKKKTKKKKNGIAEDMKVKRSKKRKLKDTNLAVNGASADTVKKSKKSKKSKKLKKLAKLSSSSSESAADLPKAKVKLASKKKKSKLKKKTKKQKLNGATSSSKAANPTASPEADKAFRESHNISIHLPSASSEEPCFSPFTTFAQAKALFPGCATEAVEHCCKSFEKPSPIQAQAWPIVLSGQDLIGVAATGSGKTLAFLLPGIAKLLSGGCGERVEAASCPQPRILVLSPTRELAIQSAKVLQEACEVIEGVEAMVVFGGQPKREQRAQLKEFGSSLDMIVATPGRLLDFIDDRAIALSSVTYLVLDEADRMLDMGFEKDVKRIISMCATEKRQTVMFSATWPQEIRAIARTYLHDAIRIVVGSEKLSASASVKQHVEVLEPFAKEKRLRQLLGKIHDGKNRVIVFGLYKKECARLEQNLLRQGYQVAGIHGDKAQHQREDAVRRFDKGELPILVATDVASRGLDIENVEYVVNYSFPLTVEDYVHRIGRTGRAGKRGIAYTFFTTHDKHLAGALQNVLRQAGEKIPEELSKFGNTVKKKTHKMYGAHFRQDDMPMKKPTRIVFD